MGRESVQRSRTKSTHQRSSGTTISLTPSPFVLGFLGVLLLGGIGLAAFVVARRPDSGELAAPNSSVPPASLESLEPNTWFTPEGDPVFGSPNAPTTIVEFSDYQCPNCRQFALDVMPWLRESWIANGMVRVVYRDFAIRGEASTLAARAAHCAGEQGRYWAYHDRLFAWHGEGNAFTSSALAGLANEIGIDGRRLSTCLDSGRHTERVQASTDFAHAQGFEGTPTYLIDGRKAAGALAIADWEALFRSYERDFASATEAAKP